MLKNRSGQYSYPIGRQKGSVLLVSLIMLLLLTLIAVGGMQGTILQERMTGNLRDRDLAFQAAEAGLRDAENFLEGGPGVNFNNANGFYDVNNANRPDWNTRNTDDRSGAKDYTGAFKGVADQPKYFIEEIATLQPAGTETETGVALPPVSYYRITALGFGGSANTSVVLTSVYRSQ
jgi:type IV pilus assembly protein PilX